MTIQKITTYVFVGCDEDLKTLKTQPAIVHAAKDPWHRQAVGYITRGAPKESPEYYYAMRNYYNELSLNLIDVDDARFVSRTLMDAAVNFVNYWRCKRRNVLIHCNQGVSRGPTVGFLAIAPNLSADFDEAFQQFSDKYVGYNPRRGLYEFARDNWAYYQGSGQDVFIPQEPPAEALGDVVP